ncbi:MAG: hypothetical protein QOJ01_1496, partial [Solirubrobacterales bacterium]|nr:hypothetical protein [Solirubrobacterales bacterium]
MARALGRLRLSAAAVVLLTAFALVAALAGAVPEAGAHVYWAIRGSGAGTTIGRANPDGGSANPNF